MNPGMMGMGMSRADARVFAGKAADDPRVQRELLPLPKRYFPKVRLSSAMVREYQATAKALLDEALEQLRRERIYGGVDETSWRDVGASSGFKRYTKTENDEQHFRVQGTIRASLSGLMRVLFAENDRRLADRRKALYNDFLDAQTLCVLKDRTPTENEHMAIRWLAIELSASSDANKRDMCVLEYTGTTVDRENQPIGFKVSHSIQLAECKSLKQTHGLLRRVGTDVLLVRQASDNGHSEIILSGSSDAASEVSAWLLSSYMTSIAGALGKLPVVVQERCLASMPLLDKAYWVPTSDRKSCHVCVSKFGYLSKKHNCRACGEVTCKSCIVTRSVGEESKFCKKCIIVATSRDDLSSAQDRSDASSFASRSSITSVTSQSSSASSTGFQPTMPAATKFHVDMKLLDDLRRDNSFAATEDSYGSSTSTLSMDQSFESRPVSSLDEDHVMFVDTRDMHRQFEAMQVNGAMPEQHSSSRGHNSTRGYASQPMYAQQPQSHSSYYHHQQQPHQPSCSTRPQPPPQQQHFHTTPGGYSTRNRGAVPPMSAPVANFQHVEDSIAHQRHLLEKMMYQARYKAAAAYP